MLNVFNSPWSEPMGRSATVHSTGSTAEKYVRHSAEDLYRCQLYMNFELKKRGFDADFLAFCLKHDGM